eukprot:COSAG01_NODE_4837_length_4695_cov_90.434508_4_plen_100_part_00
MSYHNWQQMEADAYELVVEKLKQKIEKHHQVIQESEEEEEFSKKAVSIIPERELSDIAYMTKLVNDLTSSDEEVDDSDDSDWTPHVGSSEEDSDSDEEY